MDCCSTATRQAINDIGGTNTFFTRWSKTYEKRFRKKGLAKEQKYLIEGITRTPLASKTILDVGSGVGSIHLSLLQRGAATAIGVDIAEGMIHRARQLAGELGLDDRTRYIVGDFVAMNGDIPLSDITILDKVVCCYEDVDMLVEKSTSKTKEIYALTFPRESFFVQIMFKTQIFICDLLRFSFRPYWHDWRRICQKITASGFENIYHNKTLFWTVHVYRRHDG
jgi:predicted TPR repeat methyltransferase